MRSRSQSRDLLGLLVVVLSVLGFGLLASEKADRASHAFDQRILQTMHDHAAGRQRWLPEAQLEDTALREPGRLTTLTIATIGFILIRGHWRNRLPILSAQIGGQLWSLASDVVAGWALGVACAIASSLIAASLEARTHRGAGRR